MIEVKNITKSYRSGEFENKVLKNVSFSIKEGEFVAIMGPSGSGKSTLMHILGCLDTPTEGQYFFEGKDISQFSDDELADIRKNKIGFVFQAFNLLPRSTVLRNVTLPLVYSRVSKEKREELAQKSLLSVGLAEDKFTHLSNQLSGGEMQRVAIARALVNNPSVILADEPTGNLDTKTGEIVIDTFKKLNDQGRTVVLITHEKDIAEKAKRIISIKDGQIIQDYASV
jgi:putative ABC transport system ATP-binding protein